MATENLWALSKTPANNDDALIDNGVDLRETVMTVPQINDTGRALCAVIRAHLDTVGGTITLGGSAGAFTFTSPTGFPFRSYFAGMQFRAYANHTPAGAATINVDGLGAKNIHYWDGNGWVATAGGEITNGELLDLSYDGTQFRLISARNKQPDATITASVLAAVTGNITNINGTTGNITNVNSATLVNTGNAEVHGGLDVGFNSTPVADNVRVGDANFGLNFFGGEGGTAPALVYDANDMIYYDRVNNDWNVTINSIDVVRAQSSGFYIGPGGFIGRHSVSNSSLEISGDVAAATGANLLLNGSTNAGPNNFALRVGATGIIFFSGTTNILNMNPSAGITVGTPTGGGKGAGSLNAQAVFDDNVLLSDYIFDFYEDGNIKEEDRDAAQAVGFKPEWYDQDWVRAYWKKERCLPWMPTRAQWKEGKMSVGELINRLWAGQEIIASWFASA